MTAALVAVTCDWTCWKLDSAAPVGRVGATPPSELAASTAAWACRTWSSTCSDDSSATSCPLSTSCPSLTTSRSTLAGAGAFRSACPAACTAPGALTRSTTSAIRTGSAAYRPSSPEPHPARTSTPTSPRAAAAPVNPCRIRHPFLTDDAPGQHSCARVVLRRSALHRVLTRLERKK